MRKILVIVLICFCSFLKAQNWNVIANGSKYTQTTFLGGIKCDSGLILPTIANLTTQHFATSLGAICKYNDSLYFRTATGWINIMRTATSSTFDTTSLSNRIDEKQDIIATGTTSQYLRGDGSLATFPTIPSAIDTTSLSNRINAKLNISDTASMLTNYLAINDAASGDLAGTYPSPTVSKVQGVSMQSGTPTANDVWVYGGSPAKWQHQSINASQVDNNSTVSGTHVSDGLNTLNTGKVNVSDTASMLAAYLRSNVASSTYATISNLALKVAIADTSTMLSKYLRKTDTTTMLNPYLTTITSNSDAIYNTATFSSNNHVGTLTQNLATQTSYKLLGTGNASATPTFRTIDSNYFNNTFATQVRAAQTNTGGTVTSLTLGRGITGTSPITTSGTIGLDTTQAYTFSANNTFSTSITTPQIYGSSSSSGNLNLKSTSNATLGNIYLNAMSSGNTNTNGGVFIGRASADPLPIAGDPNHLFGIVNDSSNKQMFSMWSFGSGGTYQNNMHFYRANGTIASPRTLTSGQFLVSMGFRGYDGTAMSQSAAAFQVLNNSNWTTSNHESRFQWEVTDSLSTTRLRAMQLNGNGSLWLTKNSSLLPYRTSTQFVIDGAGSGYTGDFRALLQSTTTNGAGMIFGESTSSESYLVRYGSAYSGTYTTGVNCAASFNLRSGGTYNQTLVLGGTPIINQIGTTTTNIGTRLDATGLRVDQIQNLSTSNNNVFTANGKSYLGANSTATALLHLAAGTSTANTAPLKFTSGTNLATAENGSVEYDGTDYFVTANSQRQTLHKGKFGSFSGVGTATTTFTVTFGGTQPNATYKVVVTPTSSLSAALFYVTNKTTTTFDVMYLAGLTGTVTFDYLLTQ